MCVDASSLYSGSHTVQLYAMVAISAIQPNPTPLRRHQCHPP
ncbi:hypothetical protein DOY81_010738 [Sarcophaga bullata]|nr:hypothetical protein DOY81_010738 [Sarcophaga bullata]